MCVLNTSPLDAAEPLQSLLEDRTRVLGADGPVTFGTRRDLADVLVESAIAACEMFRRPGAVPQPEPSGPTPMPGAELPAPRENECEARRLIRQIGRTAERNDDRPTAQESTSPLTYLLTYLALVSVSVLSPLKMGKWPLRRRLLVGALEVPIIPMIAALLTMFTRGR
jgi:hypothetical protein